MASEIDQLLVLAESEVQKAEHEAQVTAERATVAQARAERARASRDSLRELVTRLRETPPTPVKEYHQLVRADAIERLLREQGGSMTPKQIAAELNDRGRDADTPALISATLDTLKHRGIVERAERHGHWQLALSAAPSVNGAAGAGKA